LDFGNFFGSSISSLGDLNQDSIPDIIVGASQDGFLFFIFFLILNLTFKNNSLIFIIL